MKLEGLQPCTMRSLALDLSERVQASRGHICTSLSPSSQIQQCRAGAAGDGGSRAAELPMTRAGKTEKKRKLLVSAVFTCEEERRAASRVS